MKKILFLPILAVGILASCGMRSGNKQVNVNEINAMKTVELNKADFYAKVANLGTSNEWKYLGDKPAIIDFYADWCGPCKAIAPVLEELAAEYDGQIVIYKVNVDKEQELAGAFGVRSIPSLLFVPLDGKPQMVQGAMPKASFEEHIKSVLLKK